MAATGVIFPYGNGIVFAPHFAKGSLRYAQTLRFPDASKAVCSLSRPLRKNPQEGIFTRWAALSPRMEPIGRAVSRLVK